LRVEGLTLRCLGRVILRVLASVLVFNEILNLRKGLNLGVVSFFAGVRLHVFKNI